MIAKAGHRSSVRRFDSPEIDPSSVRGLKPDHPALIEGRTIFQSSVVGTMESPRFLVSGHNNPKLGKTVLKGTRTGWPIFHVSLEERATCPRSCHAWSTCYGNSTPYSRRHRPDDDLIPTLKAEVITLARANPDGLLVRLHTLGDFYSTAYVEAWVELLAKLPQLAVFGYTARREDADDVESRKIAKMIRLVSTQAWERFSIRFSRAEAGPQRSIIVDEDPRVPEVVVCPAQTKQTEACASCGLCWAPNARDKTIAFLRHGMTTRREPRAVPLVIAGTPPVPPAERPQPRPGSTSERVIDKLKVALPGLFERHPEGVFADALVAATGETYDRTVTAVKKVAALGLGQWVYSRTQRGGKVLLPPAMTLPDGRPATQTQAMALGAIVAMAVDGECAAGYRAICAMSGVAHGSIVYVIDGLVSKGFIEIIEKGNGARPTRFRVLAKALDAPAAAVSQICDTAPPTVEAPQAKRTPAPSLTVPAPAKPLIPARAFEIDEGALQTPGNGRLAQLRAGQCRWPLDDPGPGLMDRTMFCGAASGDETYCAEHTQLSLPPRAARRALERRT